jgi:hypothetical protein
MAEHLQRLLAMTSRVERVIMMSLIRLLLKGMQDIVPIVWVAIIYGSMNIVCMTLLHTVNSHTVERILSCARRITLFVFTHAIMKASLDTGTETMTDSSNKVVIFLKGFAVLCFLTLVPKSVTDEDDGEAFSSQITYAYATNMGGVLDPLHTSRLFTLVTLLCIVVSPQIHRRIDKNNRILSNCIQALDLVVFDAFTSQAFVESGDSFCDLSIVLGSFCILWNFQNIAPDMNGIQQFTTWRTAAFVSKILGDIQIDGITLAVMIFVLTMIHSQLIGCSSIIDATPWMQDLMFLVSLNGIISETQAYIEAIGTIDGVPIMFGLIVMITTINVSTVQYSQRYAQKEKHISTV